jgi:hypothetical protein
VSEYPDSTTYVAPIVLLATGVIRDWLGSSPSAPGILLRVQHALRTQRVVALTGDGHAPVQLLAATFWDLIEETDTSPPFALEVDDASFCWANGSASAQPVDIAQLGALRASLLGSRSFVRPEILHVDYEQTHSEFALRLALSDQTTFPWAPTPADSAQRDAVFVVETLDGRDDTARRTLQLVRGMAELAGDVLLHLVLTESTVRDADEVALSPFATVTSLMSLSRREREDVLLVVLGSADVVVDMGTAAFLAILPRLRRTGSRSCATDLGRTEALESMLAAYGSLIDHFLAASEEQRQACIDLGAPPDTVILVPGDLAALLDAVGLVRA